MKLFVVNAVASRRTIILLTATYLGLLVLYFISGGQVARASFVQAIVCREGATLAITQPVSDSIVTDTSVSLTGDVSQANQIEILIDGQFDGIVPLNAAATSFTAYVQLSPGTHTIRLTAVDACQIGNAVASTVVTYQPATISSTGGQVPTEVGATTNGVTVGPLVSAEPVSGISFTTLVAPLVGLGAALDLTPVSNTPTVSGVPPLIHFGLLVGGLATILLSSQLTTIGMTFRPLRWLTGWLGLHTTIRARGVSVAIGIALIVLTFIV